MQKDQLFVQLSVYAERASHHKALGNEILSQFFVQQGLDLIEAYEQGLLVIDTEKL